MKNLFKSKLIRKASIFISLLIVFFFILNIVTHFVPAFAESPSISKNFVNSESISSPDLNEELNFNPQSFPTSNVAAPTPVLSNKPIPTIKSSSTTAVSTKVIKFKNINAWIATFDYQNGKNSFYKNINKFTSVSPVFYNLNDDGTVSARAQAGDKDLISRSKKAGVKVMPIIISFSADGLKNMLLDPVKYQAHLDFIDAEITKHGYDGIDIDYESIYLDTKEQYLQMIKDLHDKLKPKGKFIAVDVIAKYSDETYSVLPQTRASQDWTRIAQYADEVRIMAYDYTSLSQPNNNQKGPVAPLNWTEDILKYAITKMPKEKITLGLPHYAYAYDDVKRYGLTYENVNYLLTNFNIKPAMDPSSQEKIFSYPSGGKTREVWYHDAETLLLRYELAEKYGIGGISFWRMGGEDQRTYGNISK